MHIFDELKRAWFDFSNDDEESFARESPRRRSSFHYAATWSQRFADHDRYWPACRNLDKSSLTQLAGHKPYALVGGATGLIGIRPSKMLNVVSKQKDTVDGWVQNLSRTTFSFSWLWKRMAKTRLSWSTTTTGLAASASHWLPPWYRKKYFTILMMSKESVEKRIEQEFHTLSLPQIMQVVFFCS